MTPRARLLRTFAVAILSIGLFSLTFSLLSENGLWPELPPGALHGTDRVAGFLAAIGLVIALASERSGRAVALERSGDAPDDPLKSGDASSLSEFGESPGSGRRTLLS